ncbi:hypothetical protein DIPPA_70062 [Diplonema papillatum]|nr:hypothetical protein DIPPA_70062 [Diplonema papillatum]
MLSSGVAVLLSSGDAKFW